MPSRIATNEALRLSGSVRISTAKLWTPAEINPIFWYDFSDQSTLTFGPSGISQIDDKSANNYHLSQAVSADQPTQAVKNGYYTADCDGATNHLEDTHNIESRYDECAFMVLFDPDSVTGTGRSVFSMESSAASNDWEISRQENPWSGRLRIGTTAVNPDYLSNSNDWQLIQWVGSVTAGTLDIKKNCSVISTQTDFSALDKTNIVMRIAADRDGNDNEKCDIAEILMVPNTEESITKTEGYLLWKWGLESLLPVNHPYKSGAPIL